MEREIKLPEGNLKWLLASCHNIMGTYKSKITIVNSGIREEGFLPLQFRLHRHTSSSLHRYLVVKERDWGQKVGSTDGVSKMQ